MTKPSETDLRLIGDSVLKDQETPTRVPELRMTSKREEEARWLDANREAIQKHVAWLEANGLPLKPAWPD